MKTINADFSKIIDIQPFDDGIALRRSTSQKTQYFSWPNTVAKLSITVSGRNYREPFTGFMFQYIVEGLTRR
jgi:hypothetical protein